MVYESWPSTPQYERSRHVKTTFCDVLTRFERYESLDLIPLLASLGHKIRSCLFFSEGT